MANGPYRPPRRNGHSNDPIELGTGEFEQLKSGDVRPISDDGVPVLPPTKVLSNDPQRVVPTHVYQSEAFNPPLPAESSFNPPLPSDSFNPPLPPVPSDTHSLPQETDKRRSKPAPPVVERAVLEPAFLYVDRGPGEGRNVPIPDGELVIGRASNCRLKIAHPSVSREHAILERKGTRFFLQDAGSHNGTYVNGRQITGRVEVFGGDELAMGKAVLILRYGQEASRHGTHTNAPLTERKSFRIAIVGSAIALGIIAVLILDQLKPVPVEPTRPVAATPTEPAKPEPRPPPRPVVADSVKPEPAKDPPPSDPKVGKGDLNLVQPAEISASKVFQEAKDRGEPTPTRLEIPTKILDNRRGPPRASPKKVATAKSTVDTAGAEEAMALYEAGDLDGAIGSAKAIGNGALAGKIATFKKAIASAKAALANKDGGSAIKHYTAALAIDDELSKGWGKIGGQIRVELSKLYVMAGNQTADRGDNSAALRHYERALKYDPENEKAKEGAAKVRSAPATESSAPAPAKQPDDARSAADQAFDQ